MSADEALEQRKVHLYNLWNNDPFFQTMITMNKEDMTILEGYVRVYGQHMPCPNRISAEEALDVITGLRTVAPIVDGQDEQIKHEPPPARLPSVPKEMSPTSEIQTPPQDFFGDPNFYVATPDVPYPSDIEEEVEKRDVASMPSDTFEVLEDAPASDFSMEESNLSLLPKTHDAKRGKLVVNSSTNSNQLDIATTPQGSSYETTKTSVASEPEKTQNRPQASRQASRRRKRPANSDPQDSGPCKRYVKSSAFDLRDPKDSVTAGSTLWSILDNRKWVHRKLTSQSVTFPECLAYNVKDFFFTDLICEKTYLHLQQLILGHLDVVCDQTKHTAPLTVFYCPVTPEKHDPLGLSAEKFSEVNQHLRASNLPQIRTQHGSRTNKIPLCLPSVQGSLCVSRIRSKLSWQCCKGIDDLWYLHQKSHRGPSHFCHSQHFGAWIWSWHPRSSSYDRNTSAVSRLIKRLDTRDFNKFKVRQVRTKVKRARLK